MLYLCSVNNYWMPKIYLLKTCLRTSDMFRLSSNITDVTTQDIVDIVDKDKVGHIIILVCFNSIRRYIILLKTVPHST